MLRWWKARRKARRERIEELNMRPPVMQIRFRIGGFEMLDLDTYDLYLALKYAGYGAGIETNEWFELLGFAGMPFKIGETKIELEVREVK